jgi:hypothetical protein
VRAEARCFSPHLVTVYRLRHDTHRKPDGASAIGIARPLGYESSVSNYTAEPVRALSPAGHFRRRSVQRFLPDG